MGIGSIVDAVKGQLLPWYIELGPGILKFPQDDAAAVGFEDHTL